jgi:cation:H+ antiporter
VIAGYTALAAAAIFAAGYVLARTGEALAEQTGLGASFVGAVLVAIATSLPEVSSTLAAVRLGQYELAFADIFGTNLLDIALIALADAVYSGGPVLGEVGAFSAFAALLGIAVTAIFLGGLIERRDKVVLRVGVDSLLVLLVYAGGLAVLFRLRG